MDDSDHVDNSGSMLTDDGEGYVSPEESKDRARSKRSFTIYRNDNSTASTPQKKFPVTTLSSGSESELDLTKSTVKPSRRLISPSPELSPANSPEVRAVDIASDSDDDPFKDVQLDEMQLLKQCIGFKHHHYANTTCCSRGYKKDLLKTGEAVRLLCGIKASDPVATEVPFMPQDNCMFILDTSQLVNWKDMLSDHLGSWRQNRGGEKYWFSRSGDPVPFAENDEDEEGPLRHEFRRRVYHHSKSKDLRRLVISSPSFRYALVQYVFDEEPHGILPPPHGNRRHGDGQYSRTFESVKEEVKACGRKDGMNRYNEQKNEFEKFDHPDKVIKGAKQVRNLTQNQQPKDDLWELVCQSKVENEQPQQFFIRDIVAAPEMVVFLASERQLDDLVKFCTDEHSFSVLGVDTLFNVGEFLVTVVTYRHLMLKSLRSYSGIHPVMIGAILIHTGKSELTYSYLPYFLKKYRPQLQNVRAFGSDEEKAIWSPLRTAFPSASHFLCDLHLKDTIKRKMHELSVDQSTSTTIIGDVFGIPDGDTVIGGLINCETRHYDAQLETTLDKWSYLTDAGDKFATYFRRFKADQIKNCALLEKRIAAGLGLSVYTQNANESSNNVLKDAAKREKVTLNQFVEVAREVTFKQTKEVELAAMARSERLFLLEEYKHLRVEDSVLYNTTVNPTAGHRAKTMNSIHHAKLLPKRCTLASQAAFNELPFREHPVTPENLDERTEHFVTDSLNQFEGLAEELKSSVLLKAFKLLKSRTESMSKIPGKTLECGALVASENNTLQPNVLEMDRQTGKISCTCRGYQLHTVCAHAVAVAADRNIMTFYKNWFNKKNRKQFDKAVKHGVSSKVASKPSSTSRRKAPSKEFQPVKAIVTGSSIYHAISATDVRTEELPSTSQTKSASSQRAASLTRSLSASHSADLSIVFAEKPMHVKVSPEPYTYEIHFLIDCHSATRKCAGCHNSIHVGGKIGPPPEDIVVVSRIPRTYKSKGEIMVGAIGNAYFHLNVRCITKELPDFSAKKLIVGAAVRMKLLPVNYMHLKKVFKWDFV